MIILFDFMFGSLPKKDLFDISNQVEMQLDIWNELFLNIHHLVNCWLLCIIIHAIFQKVLTIEWLFDFINHVPLGHRNPIGFTKDIITLSLIVCITW